MAGNPAIVEDAREDAGPYNGSLTAICCKQPYILYKKFSRLTSSMKQFY